MMLETIHLFLFQFCLLMRKELSSSYMKYLRFTIFSNPIIQYWISLKILTMENSSGERSNQVQDDEKNGKKEKSPIPVSLKRHRNEEKDSLAIRKQESQGRVTKRKKTESLY